MTDLWPTEENRIADSDYLAAFGQITLAYNMLEDMMGRIFEDSAPLHNDFANRLFHDLNNQERTDLLRAFIEKNESNSNARDALLHLVRCYSICTANRNVLMHVRADGVSEATATERWTKRASQNPARFVEFHLKLPELRMVADEIIESVRYAWNLHAFLQARYTPRPWAQLVALPEKPPRPRSLTPYQPQEGP